MNERDAALYQQYIFERQTPDYLNVFEKTDPLVSVLMATYNAAEMLVNHSLKSVLNQTHRNLEIIIIDDGSTDDTVECVKAINDPRIIIETIPHQENMNWFATSVAVINHGLKRCTGDYVSHLDDDDWFYPERIEKLVNFNRTAKAEIIHHPFLIHYESFQTYKRIMVDSNNCASGEVTTSTLFYHGWFSKVPIGDDNPQTLEHGGDWDKARKILEFGGKAARFPEMLMLKNGHRHCDPLRNRVYRPQPEDPEMWANIKNWNK